MTQAISSLSTVAYIYRIRYSDKQVTELALREHPLFYRIAKEMEFDGSGFAYPLTTGNPQGISAKFANAQTNADTLKGVQLQAQPFTKYGVLELDGPSMMRARGNKGSFYNLVTRSQDGVLDELGAAIAYDLYRDGTGLRGQIAAGGITGNVITVTNKRDVEHFKRGMTIAAATAANGTSPRTGTAKIVGLARNTASGTGTITVDNIAGITSIAVGDYLFRDGDIPSQCMEGMDVCTPLTPPTAGDSFRGIDRSVDVEALAGSRISDATRYPEEMLGDLGIEVGIIGKKQNEAYCFPSTFQAMTKRLGAKVMFEAGKTADVGFAYIEVIAGDSMLRVYSDPDARYDMVRTGRSDAHAIKHLDDLVHIIRDDGRPSLRATSTDGIEIRARSLHNYIQHDPASFGVGSTQLT